MCKLEIELDVNTDIYPIKEGGYYRLRLTENISEDPSAEKDYFSIAQTESQFVEDHDYVMYGKIYKYQIHADKEGAEEAKM